MVKNLNERDVALCLYALEDIARENRKLDVLLRDRVMTRADINTYLRKTKRTEESLRAVMVRPTTWPTHITFRRSEPQLDTPPGSRGTTTPPLNVSSRSSRVLTPNSSLSQRTSISSMHFEHTNVPVMAEEDGIATEYRQGGPHDADDLMEDVDSCEDDEVSEEDMTGICKGLAASKNFVSMVRQTVAPKPLAPFERADPLFFTLLSKSATATHQDDQQEVPAAKAQAYEAKSARFVQPHHGTSPTAQSTRPGTEIAKESASSTEPSVSFLRECLSACIVQGQCSYEAATGLMDGAVLLFGDMISRGDPYCLTALNLLTTVLESVGQRLLAESVLRRILETTHGHWQNEGPITVTIRFMLEIVGGRAKKSEYDAKRMSQVYTGLCELWGADSPSALAGLYHVAWSLALVEETRAEAWSILDKLKVKCETILGPGHFQTITAMTTLARVLYHLGAHWQAAEMINEAIQRLDRTYEVFHPVRLEACTRQAILLMKLGGSYDVETILRDVLVRQVAILGCENPRTRFTITTLQKFHEERGRIFNLPEILRESAIVND